jgi:enoyl-CoA hydratase/carnithine racemase
VSQILYKKENHIAYISLNNPESLNALNLEMAKEFETIWVDFRDDKKMWVAILSGEGKSFCAGADIKKMERGKWKFRQSIILGDYSVSSKRHNIWKPIIAAVHRHVYGAGLLLALESDIRIASDDALFGIPEGKVNVPTLFAPFASRYMPHAIACELLYTGKPIDAQRAYQVGLVNKVVSRDHLISAATEIGKQICENGPLSIWATKELFCRGGDMDYEGALALIEHMVPPIFNSEDSIEAKQAFIEKRKPVWKLK